ncbi:hypothetical protein RF11_00924 [Thelohanellus kitauei]|uniref:Tc1-like transposase DDE domain-containing protein n=1 Tax=Thelohanellus kitauei TaxID=669202 RepID=A0A0C2J909_THEKT|nr:hypothetical protein RF11_00924 [Thelohanellus kitauei]
MSSENRSNIEESAADENTIKKRIIFNSQRKERTLMNPEKLEIMKSMIRRGADTREIALDLNISQASARRYKRKIEEAVVNNNSITLGGVQTCLAEQGISRSVSTICRILKEESFSRKRLQKIPVERNSISNMDLRQNYCRMLSNLSDDRLIYIDETGINLHTSPNFGYAPIGLTPRLQYHSQEWYTLIFLKVQLIQLMESSLKNF